MLVMDEAEMPLPAAVSKLMGSEGCRGVGVTVEAQESERDSILVCPSIDSRSSFLRQEEPAFWNKIPGVELRRHASELSSFRDEDAPKDHKIGSTKSSLLSVARPEAKQSQRKSGKVARSNGSYSKRSRVAQMEVSLDVTGIVDMNGLPKELGSCPAKCNIAEKMQMAKQKINLSGKRGDKRNGKVPKSRCDSFSVKAGLLSFSSAAGGNNILGVYGSKTDICDVTKHVDDLSLNELLVGSYKCPRFDTDKGKKAANLNENILRSVREACSFLCLQKPTQFQNIAEIDSSFQQKVSSCLVSSGSSGASRSDDDRGDTADLSSCTKVQDSCSKLESPANILDIPLYKPKDILGRLALPPPKDLDLLLLDAVKPTLASRNNLDLRLHKPVHHRGGLPTFPWSHISGGHFKSNPDAVKLATSRSTCQGRWVKIGHSNTSLGEATGFLVDLESLAYDHSLVPSEVQNPGPTEIESSPLTSVSFTSFEHGFSSSATCSVASQLPADHSSGILAAAQTLCDIATHSLKQDLQGMVRWPKKPSQKAMRASKLKSGEKSEKVFATPKSRVGSDSLVNCTNEMISSKKLRLSVNEVDDDLSHANSSTKGPLHWSTFQSSRSSPCKTYRDSVSETKHHDTKTTKKSFLMPPPARVLDKAPKLRKLMPMEWNRGIRKLD